MLRFEWQIDRVEPGNRERVACLGGRLLAIKKISFVTVLSRAFILATV